MNGLLTTTDNAMDTSWNKIMTICLSSSISYNKYMLFLLMRSLFSALSQEQIQICPCI